MKIFNSIRWRLQIWYGLVLVAVLAGFGATAYQLERGRQFRRIDDELQRRAQAVANALRPPPMRGPIPAGRAPREPFPERPPGQRPFEDGLDEGSPDRVLPIEEFRLCLERSGLFDESDTNAFYYIVTLSGRKELARSSNAPTQPAFLLRERATKIEVMEIQNNAPPEEIPRLRPPQRRLPETYKHFRELMRFAPPNMSIFVGCYLASELRELHRTAWKLTGFGAVILLLGLTGGWWIATRAMRPVEDISSTAVKIAAGDLSQRIKTSDADSELGQLATVLNSTFSRLETAFAQQQQFTSDAAHELRTPVSVMLTEAQTALNRERNASEYRETVEVCQRAAQRMRRLIESLLELARLDAGQERMKRMQFDLSGIARDCIELIRPLANERGITIHCELPQLDCVGDPEHLSQVITNLLTNAVNYNKDNGEVHISMQRQNGVAVMTVADTGVGISSEHLSHIFERFYRADASRSSGHAGLGLAICRAIIEAHGGTIEVSSTPGTGTTFAVRLPSQ